MSEMATVKQAAVRMEEQETVKEIRLYVGGLSERVTQEDIKTTFNNLGLVLSVDFVRTKGRSFAYINFLPNSLTSLPKLFSTYNGCAWKGGKLKLEKAKEHYMDRLKREWAEEAELKNSQLTNHGDVEASGVDLLDSQSTPDLKNMEFRIFFPKLRKVKPLPLSGTGKHKYSFRRLEGPPIPVHICDCPEHSVPVQTDTVTSANNLDLKKGGVRQEEYVDKFHSRVTTSDHKVADHDSEMQDVGLNEEEINMMESVMKKLLDRGTSLKQDRKNPPFSQEKTTNVADEGTDDDDDIKINTVAVQNFSSFSFRSRETEASLPTDETLPNEETNETDDDDDDIQINAVSGRNKRQTSLANEITKLDEWRNQKIESSNRKRKSISMETNVDDLAPPIHEKKGHLNIPLKKPGWKQLVGNGSSSSFSLSQITSENDTNHNDLPKLGNNAPDIKKSKKTRKVVPKTPTLHEVQEEANNSAPRGSEKVPRVALEEPEPSDEAPAGSEDYEEDDKSAPAGSEENEVDDKSASDGSKEHEEANDSSQMGNLTLQQKKKGNKVSRDASEEPKPIDEAPASSEEREENNNSARKETQSSKRRKKNKKARKVVLKEPKPNDNQVPAVGEEDGVMPADCQSSEPPATQGSSWLQRSTWTQLVGGDNNSSFSISQILSGDLVQKQSSYKRDDFNTVSFTSAGAFSKEKRTSEMASDLSIAKEDTQVASTSKPKPTSLYAGRGVQISESCPFMRNADSMKEWATAKTSMRNSLKKIKNK